MKIGFIGLGNMAKAIIGGCIKGEIVKASDITGSAKSRKSMEEARKNFGINISDNRGTAEDSDIVVLAVKPQVLEEVLTQIRDIPSGDKKIFLSIAAGKDIAWLSERLPENAKIVRCMPNTPALVNEGCSGVCRNVAVTDEEFSLVMKLLESFGKAYEIKESMMDGVVAVSGSSPAYIFMLIEAMADGAVLSGLPRKTAIEMAAQSVLGSARLLLESGKHPGELKDMVCSPAGTTIEAVRVLEERGFRAAVIAAEKACAEKNRSL